MKPQIRELLVTAKVAEHWEGHFEQKVDELLELVKKVDTEEHVQHAGELLDVYHKVKQKPGKLKKRKVSDCRDKPFEFIVFRN